MSGTVRLNADGTTKTKAMTKIAKGVGNMKKIAPAQKARASTASLPQGMTVVGQLSVVDLVNLVVLWGIPVQRNYDFTVKADHAIMSTDALVHQNAYAFCHLRPFIPLL